MAHLHRHGDRLISLMHPSTDNDSLGAQPKPPADSHLTEVEARLFKDRSNPIAGNRFSSVRRENSALHWNVVSREQEVLRAAGFSG